MCVCVFVCVCVCVCVIACVYIIIKVRICKYNNKYVDVSIITNNYVYLCICK